MAQTETRRNSGSLDINKKIISNIDDGIIVLDDELTIHYCNKWMEIHTGNKADIAVGKKLNEIYPQINAKTLIRKIKTANRMQTPTFYAASTSQYLIPIEIDQIKISKFTHMQQDVSIIPLDEDEGLVALIIKDQTEVTNTNTLLEENINKVRELNSELIKERDTIDKKVLLLKIDNDANITDISQAYLELLGYTKDEILDNNFFILEKLHIDDTLRDNFLEAMNERKVYEFELSTLTRKGKELWIKNTLVPEFDPNMHHIGFIIFKEDITDSRKVIEQTEKLLANSRSSAMGEMVSMIAHQWRQPLSVINTIIATLKIKHQLQMLNNEIMDESFDKIEDTVVYLSETIDDFRDFFKQNKKLESVSLEKIMEKSTSLLLEEMKHYEIEYSQTIENELMITTYKNELVQSMINIIKNSVDAFKEQDREQQKIEVRVQKHNTHISISVEDNAGGIDKEVLKHVFEPYFSTKSKNGTGLGLYMCKTIIEGHLGGKITITSQADHTKTLIELPLVLDKRE